MSRYHQPKDKPIEMSVKYRFKSSLEYSTLFFPGNYISVGDLRKEITRQKRLAVNADYELQIMNAETKHVYEFDPTLIPADTNLIVSRVPVVEKTRQEESSTENMKSTNIQQMDNNSGTASYTEYKHSNISNGPLHYQYPGDSYANTQYPGGSYPNNQYPGYSYANNQYPGDLYTSNQYSGDPYSSNQYSGDPYSNNQYSGDSYANNYENQNNGCYNDYENGYYKEQVCNKSNDNLKSTTSEDAAKEQNPNLQYISLSPSKNYYSPYHHVRRYSAETDVIAAKNDSKTTPGASATTLTGSPGEDVHFNKLTRRLARADSSDSSVPPVSYRCFKCNVHGHWIKNCPLSAEKEFKRSTGIPRSQMVIVNGPEEGSYLTPEGLFAIPKQDFEAKRSS